MTRFSLSSEVFRQLRTKVRFLNAVKQVRALVVTGSVTREGVTTVASNLAVGLAQSGDTVILVDASFRQPMLSELFGLNPALGLSNVLAQSTRLDDALQVLLVTDAAALSRFTDGTVLVCQTRSTKADQLERASQSLR